MKKIGLSFVSGLGPASSTEILKSAITAERSGYDSVWVPELYYSRESFSILGAIAQATRRIKTATAVVNPYTRPPSLIAMSIATLDELTNGRAILGLGSGGRIGAEVHGIPPEHKGLRADKPLSRLRECILILRELLSGRRMNYQGSFYDIEDARLEFRPKQPRIPIYLGQQGPAMMRLTGEIADGVILTLVSSTSYIKEAIKQIAEGAGRAKRRPSEITITARIVVSMSRDRRRALDEAKPIVGRVLIHPGSRPVIEASKIDTAEVDQIREGIKKGRINEVKRLVKDEWVEMLTASGTPRECRERIEDYRDAGVRIPLVVPIGRNYIEVIKALAHS